MDNSRSFLGGRVEKWIVGGEAEIEYIAEEDFSLRCKIKSIFIQQWEWFSRKGEIDGVGGQGDI